MLDEPEPTRPYMPGYGILGAEEGSGLLAWSWAVERLTTSHSYWLATVRPDGRPHVMPVWGVWAQDSLWFSCSPGSRKTRNLAASPRAVATTDNPDEPVVVEGDVERVESGEDVAAFADRVNAKYETAYSVDFFLDNVCFRLTPVWAFGLEECDFTGTPTRWDLGAPVSFPRPARVPGGAV